MAPDDYTAVNTTITFAAGVTTATVMVPIVSDAVVEPNETLTLTLSNPTGASIAPDLCLVATPTTCTAALTIIDDDQGGVIQFGAANYTVTETGGPATVTLTRAGGLAGGVTVTFGATAGTAAPGDFSVPSGTVTFLAGSGQRDGARSTSYDNLVADGDRTVNLSISAPAAGRAARQPDPRAADERGADHQGQRAARAVRRADVHGGRGGADGGDQRDADGRYLGAGARGLREQRGNGDAPGPTTRPTSGTVTFGAGVTTQTFTVTITNDSAPETPETVLLTLSNPRTNNPADIGRVALGSPNPATLTITDNDKAGTLSLNASAYTISETGDDAPRDGDAGPAARRAA